MLGQTTQPTTMGELLETDRMQAFAVVDELLDLAQFPEAIERMNSWDTIWLNQFYQIYPHRYGVIKHEYFNEFWAKRRMDLNPNPAFLAQKNIADIDFVLGYVFYLLALRADEKQANDIKADYLQLALKFHSIHAAEMFMSQLLAQKESDKVKKMKTIITVLLSWDSLAALHGAPGYLLLAQGYLPLVQWSLDLKNNDAYKKTSFSLWKNIILTELEEPQSAASIHNAYLGEGLGHGKHLPPVSLHYLKVKAMGLIEDNSIMLRAAERARIMFVDDESEDKMQTWLKSRNRWRTEE